MNLVITINTDNAAFDDNCITELTYVVNQIPKVVTGTDGGKLKDSYGNTVGDVAVTPEVAQ